MGKRTWPEGAMTLDENGKIRIFLVLVSWGTDWEPRGIWGTEEQAREQVCNLALDDEEIFTGYHIEELTLGQAFEISWRGTG